MLSPHSRAGLMYPTSSLSRYLPTCQAYIQCPVYLSAPMFVPVIPQLVCPHHGVSRNCLLQQPANATRQPDPELQAPDDHPHSPHDVGDLPRQAPNPTTFARPPPNHAASFNDETTRRPTPLAELPQKNTSNEHQKNPRQSPHIRIQPRPGRHADPEQPRYSSPRRPTPIPPIHEDWQSKSP